MPVAMSVLTCRGSFRKLSGGVLNWNSDDFGGVGGGWMCPPPPPPPPNELLYQSLIEFPSFSQGDNRAMSSSMDDSDEEFDQLSSGPDGELEKVHVLCACTCTCTVCYMYMNTLPSVKIFVEINNVNK